MDLSNLRPSELLALHVNVADELRTRGITRSSNNPTGDLAEYLCCKAFGWNQTGNSNRSIDAVDSRGLRYQIKGRRMTRYNDSRQLSAIRNMDGAHFDFLVGVLFNEDYSIMRGAMIPYSVALERSSFVKYTNSHKFMLRDDVWAATGVRDITNELRAVDL